MTKAEKTAKEIEKIKADAEKARAAGDTAKAEELDRKAAELSASNADEPVLEVLNAKGTRARLYDPAHSDDRAHYAEKAEEYAKKIGGTVRKAD